MGTFRKEIHGHELYLFNGKGELIFKRWLNQGRSVVFDVMTYDKHTLVSISEETLKQKQDDKHNISAVSYTHLRAHETG
jgi:hypothetical protein